MDDTVSPGTRHGVPPQQRHQEQQQQPRPSDEGVSTSVSGQQQQQQQQPSSAPRQSCQDSGAAASASHGQGSHSHGSHGKHKEMYNKYVKLNKQRAQQEAARAAITEKQRNLIAKMQGHGQHQGRGPHQGQQQQQSMHPLSGPHGGQAMGMHPLMMPQMHYVPPVQFHPTHQHQLQQLAVGAGGAGGRVGAAATSLGFPGPATAHGLQPLQPLQPLQAPHHMQAAAPLAHGMALHSGIGLHNLQHPQVRQQQQQQEGYFQSLPFSTVPAPPHQQWHRPQVGQVQQQQQGPVEAQGERQATKAHSPPPHATLLHRPQAPTPDPGPGVPGGPSSSASMCRHPPPPPPPRPPSQPPPPSAPGAAFSGPSLAQSRYPSASYPFGGRAPAAGAGAGAAAAAAGSPSDSSVTVENPFQDKFQEVASQRHRERHSRDREPHASTAGAGAAGGKSQPKPSVWHDHQRIQHEKREAALATLQQQQQQETAQQLQQLQQLQQHRMLQEQHEQHQRHLQEQQERQQQQQRFLQQEHERQQQHRRVQEQQQRQQQRFLQLEKEQQQRALREQQEQQQQQQQQQQQHRELQRERFLQQQDQQQRMQHAFSFPQNQWSPQIRQPFQQQHQQQQHQHQQHQQHQQHDLRQARQGLGQGLGQPHLFPNVPRFPFRGASEAQGPLQEIGSTSFLQESTTFSQSHTSSSHFSTVSSTQTRENASPRLEQLLRDQRLTSNASPSPSARRSLEPRAATTSNTLEVPGPVPPKKQRHSERVDSPVDLSVRTVRRSADSTAWDDSERTRSRTSPVMPRVDFVPDFSASHFDSQSTSSQEAPIGIHALQGLPRADELPLIALTSGRGPSSPQHAQPSSVLPPYSSNRNSLYPTANDSSVEVPALPHFMFESQQCAPGRGGLADRQSDRPSAIVLAKSSPVKGTAESSDVAMTSRIRTKAEMKMMSQTVVKSPNEATQTNVPVPEPMTSRSPTRVAVTPDTTISAEEIGHEDDSVRIVEIEERPEVEILDDLAEAYELPRPPRPGQEESNGSGTGDNMWTAACETFLQDLKSHRLKGMLRCRGRKKVPLAERKIENVSPGKGASDHESSFQTSSGRPSLDAQVPVEGAQAARAQADSNSTKENVQSDEQSKTSSLVKTRKSARRSDPTDPKVSAFQNSFANNKALSPEIDSASSGERKTKGRPAHPLTPSESEVSDEEDDNDQEEESEISSSEDSLLSQLCKTRIPQRRVKTRSSTKTRSSLQTAWSVSRPSRSQRMSSRNKSKIATENQDSKQLLRETSTRKCALEAKTKIEKSHHSVKSRSIQDQTNPKSSRSEAVNRKSSETKVSEADTEPAPAASPVPSENQECDSPRKLRTRNSKMDSLLSSENVPVRVRHKKPQFGDGSDFRPGWEEEVFQYKRSLRMPQILIGATRAGSSTDLERCNSPASVATDNTEWHSAIVGSTVNSDFDSASNCQGIESEDVSSSTVFSTPLFSKRSPRKQALLDKLVEKAAQRERAMSLKKDKLLRKSKSHSRRNSIANESVVSKSDSIFKLKGFDSTKPITNFTEAFRVNGLLGSKQKSKPTVCNNKNADSIRAVFGADKSPIAADKKDKKQGKMSKCDLKSTKHSSRISASPPSKQKPKDCDKGKAKVPPRRNVKRADVILSPGPGVSLRPHPRASRIGAVTRSGFRSAALIKRSKVVLNTKRRKITSPSVSVEADGQVAATSSEHLQAPPKVLTLKKRMRIRRKFRSGFDYIRKKKKHVRKDTDGSSGTKLLKQKAVITRTPMTEEEIHALVRNWVINRSHGDTVLHRAARMDFPEVARYAIEKLHILPSVADNAGYTPLHVAARLGHLELAAILLELGADVSSSAQGGIRPLHEAAVSDETEMIRLLLAYGADPTLATYSNQTPLSETDPDSEAHLLLKYHLHDVEGTVAPPWKYHGPSRIFDKKTHPGDLAVASPPPLSDMDSDIEIFSSDIMPPPLHTFYGESGPTQWVLLTDLMKALEFSSEEALLKSLSSDSEKDKCATAGDNYLRTREMNAEEFFLKTNCSTFLAFGETLPVTGSKVVLVEYNKKVRALLNEEATTISSR